MTAKRTPVRAVDKTPASSKAMDSLAGTTTLVHEIPIDLIDPHPRNPRRELGELGELAESIRAHGVKQPATVVRHPQSEGRYLTVMGHRRIAAAAVAGRTTVPVIVDSMDEVEQLEVMLVENLQRTDLTISEEGDGYQGLLDLGVPKATIVRRTGRAKNTVETRLRVAGLPDPVRRHVDHHQLTIEDALVFADWKDAYPDVWEDQLEKLSNPHVMVDVVFGEAKRVVTERQALVKARTDLEAAGYKLTTGGRMIGHDDPRIIRRYGITGTEHAHCPGAEIHITGTSEGWLTNALHWGTHLCADPEKYHPEEFNRPDQPRVAREETAEERKEREAEEMLEAEINAATDSRRAWLAAVFMDDAAAHLPIRAELLAAIGERCLHVNVTFALPEDDNGARIAPQKPVDRLIFGAAHAWSCHVPDSQWELSRVVRGFLEGWSSSDAVDALAYITLIEGLGYPLTDADQRIKTDLAEAVAEVAAAETADEDQADDADTEDGA